MNVTRTVNVIRGNEDTFYQMSDKVIKEFPLNIAINGQELITLVCSPMHLDELVAGYLSSEGLIKDKNDIHSIKFSGKSVSLTLDQSTTPISNNSPKIVTSSSGKVSGNIDIKSIHFDENTKVAYSSIYEIADVLSRSSELFKDTGGVHSALLSNFSMDFTLFREDIGRHNAVDKIVGFMVLNSISPEHKILVTSGRVSSEILLKTARCGIPILVSRSAPTDLSINLANRLGITLIGFVRGRRMNIYTHERRIDITN